jgi:predicted PurR-regulated permease PerM
LNIGRKTLRNIFLGAVGCIVLYWLLFDTARVKLVLNFLKTLFAPFVLGAGLAFIVNVPMRAIENKLIKIKKPTLRRVVAVLLTFFAVALILFLVVQLLLPQLVTTMETLIAKMPGFAVRVWNSVNEFLEANPEVMDWVEVNTDFEQMDWMSYVEKLLAWVSDSVSDIVGGTFNAIGSVFTAVFNGVIALVFALYCLFRKEILARQGRRLLYAFLPEKVCDETVRILRLTASTFSNFISGQCLEAVILGAMFAVAMLIFRMPYVPLVSVLVAITALVPIVGAFVGCGLGAFFILVDDPIKAVWFVIMFLVIQQIEGNVVYPKVVGSSVGLPGMWVLLAVALGGKLMGVAGMFIMIPLVSVVYTLLREITDKRLVKRQIDGEKLIDHPPEPKIKVQSVKTKEKRIKKKK